MAPGKHVVTTEGRCPTTVAAYLASRTEKLSGTMRRSLCKRLPGIAHEIVYEWADPWVIRYSPNERGYEGVLAIARERKWGRWAVLQLAVRNCPIPKSCYDGSGKREALLHMESASAFRRPAVARLIAEAWRQRVPSRPPAAVQLSVRTRAAKKRGRHPPDTRTRLSKLGC